MVLCVAGIIKVSETSGKQEDTTYDLGAKVSDINYLYCYVISPDTAG